MSRVLFPSVVAAFTIFYGPLHAADLAVFQFKQGHDLSAPVVIELAETQAPMHAANFQKLVSKNYYHNLRIHRVLPGVLIQMGDPLSRKKDTGDLGTGGPGYTLAPEIHLKHSPGAVAMGRMSDAVNPKKLSNGSQFYICLDHLSELDGKYTVFGKVLRGLDVIQSFASLPTDTNDAPTVPIVIHKTLLVSPANLDKTLASLSPKKSSSRWQKIRTLLHLRWPF